MRPLQFNRRHSLKALSSGFGYLAFASLLSRQAAANSTSPKRGPLAPRPVHFTPRAKRVIFLCMQGGPSHIDTFDHKPRLNEDTGKSADFTNARGAKLLGTANRFAQHGSSGLWISDLYKHVAKHADDLCILNARTTELPNHPQAFAQMHTGSFQFVRPSLGAWSLYGLGTENANLPGFITINPPSGLGGSRNYGSAFLPAIYQGTKVSAGGRIGGGGGGDGGMRRRQNKNTKKTQGIENISNQHLDRDLQRSQLDLIRSLNEDKLARDVYHPEIEGIIESFELAFRMQDEVPQILDTDSEPESIRELYGIGGSDQRMDSFGRQCLMARRFAEAGVRFIEVGYGGWDHHRNLQASLERDCGATDQPIAALLTDLKQRDMLKDTLVIWGGEFGRTPYSQGSDGRDHNNKGFSMWMAGGGVRGGMNFGATDEHGYAAVDGKMDTHDWHATILHLLGLDHERLTYDYAGRDFRLTDVYGKVAHEILT